jgi:Multiubiquitin
MSAQPAHEHEPKYFVNLEGAEKPWDEPTITVAQIRELGGWDTSQPIVEINLDDNTERTLGEDETVRLKPGHGFAKKIKFQRG